MVCVARLAPYDPVYGPRIVYVSRLTRLPLVSSDGSDVGRVVDVVIDLGGRPPRVKQERELD